jgi:hypothetical protein
MFFDFLRKIVSLVFFCIFFRFPPPPPPPPLLKILPHLSVSWRPCVPYNPIQESINCISSFPHHPVSQSGRQKLLINSKFCSGDIYVFHNVCYITTILIGYFPSKLSTLILKPLFGQYVRQFFSQIVFLQT